MKFLLKPIPAIYLIACVLLFSTVITYQILHPVKVVEKVESKNTSDVRVLRNTNFKYIRPFIMADNAMEDPSYAGLRSSINQFINEQHATGNLSTASVYVRDFEQGKWFAINPEEKFSPGSMMKIMTLISYLKDSERNPNLLNTKIQFKAHFSEAPVQTIVTNELVSGRYYSIRELLETMIIDSNNDATVLLNSELNYGTYFDILKLINLSVPDKNQADYPLTTVEMSRLLRLIFNSSVMSAANSEYAMSILARSKFRDGIAKPLPDGTNIVHKFGERYAGVEQQLHETGIIYCNNKPYLLTVMTKGTDQKQLKNILASVSKQVWDFMQAR